MVYRRITQLFTLIFSIHVLFPEQSLLRAFLLNFFADYLTVWYPAAIFLYPARFQGGRMEERKIRSMNMLSLYASGCSKPYIQQPNCPYPARSPRRKSGVGKNKEIEYVIILRIRIFKTISGQNDIRQLNNPYPARSQIERMEEWKKENKYYISVCSRILNAI